MGFFTLSNILTLTLGNHWSFKLIESLKGRILCDIKVSQLGFWFSDTVKYDLHCHSTIPWSPWSICCFSDTMVLPLALWGSSSPSVPVGHGEVHCQESASGLRIGPNGSYSWAAKGDLSSFLIRD